MRAEVAESRGAVLTTLAVLMGLIAVSNFMKPVAQAMSAPATVGFMFFGHRLHGLSNAVVGPLFGVLLATYAYGAWNRRRWVAPLAVGYAIYVILNLILFTMNLPAGENYGLAFGVIYSAVAIGVSGGAIYLVRNRHLLR